MQRICTTQLTLYSLRRVQPRPDFRSSFTHSDADASLPSKSCNAAWAVMGLMNYPTYRKAFPRINGVMLLWSLLHYRFDLASLGSAAMDGNPVVDILTYS